jgi:hypothetical protein
MALQFDPADLTEGEAPADAVVVQRSAANTMPVAARAQAVMSAYATKSQLQALVAGTQHIVAITNAAGRDQASAARTALVRTRTEIARRGKEARDDANAFAKAVIAAEKELIAITTPEEERLDALVAAWEAAREAEKRAKAEAEAQRVAALRVRVEALRPRVRVHTVAALEAELKRVCAIEADDLAEFAEEAVVLQDESVAWLEAELATARAAAEAAAAAAEQRAAEERRLAEEKAALAAERERQAAERRAAEEAAAKVHAEQQAAAAALREATRKLEADAAVLRAEGERLAAARAAEERREAERVAQIERDRVVAAEEARVRAEREARDAEARAARRTRELPSRDDVIAAVAEAFDTDADIVEDWMRILFDTHTSEY